jgi:hypothetical protein
MSQAAVIGVTAERQPRSPQIVSEDWLAVWVGAWLAGLTLAGLRPGVPRFNWARRADRRLATAAGMPPS